MLKRTPCGGFYADEANFTVVDGKTILTPQAHYDIIIKVDKASPTSQKVAVLEKGDFKEINNKLTKGEVVNGIYILHANQGTSDFYGVSQLATIYMETSDTYTILQCLDSFQNMFEIEEDNSVTILSQQ